MRGKRPTVLLADDHACIRGAIRADLEELGYEVCAEAGDAEAAIEAVERVRPRLCLLDVEMPGGGGIAAARAIAERFPETRVVMLTISRDHRDVEDSLAAGAVGYVLKDVEPVQLDRVLHAALDGVVLAAPAR